MSYDLFDIPLYRSSCMPDHRSRGPINDYDLHRLNGPSGIWTIQKLSNTKQLKRVFDELKDFGGPAPGRDGLTYTDLSQAEAWAGCRDHSKAVQSGRYRPQEPRIVRMPKTSGGYRNLAIRGIFDRVLARRLAELVSIHVEPQFSTNSYGFRPRRRREQLLAALATHVEQNQAFYVVHDDIVDAFNHVRPGLVIEQLQLPGVDSAFLRAVRVILTGTARRTRQLGIDQGSPFSPLALNILLDWHLDKRIEAEIPVQGFYARYADNLIVSHADPQIAHELASRLSERLAEIGMQIRGHQPVDIRESKLEVLGVNMRFRDGQIKFTLPDNWLSRFARLIAKALEQVHYRASVRAATNSFLQSCGMTHESYTEAERHGILEHVDRELRATGVREMAMPESELRERWRHGYRNWRRHLPSTLPSHT